MVMWVIIGALAAFGCFCAAWTALGWVLGAGNGGFAVCPDLTTPEGRRFLRRCLWLRDMGLLRCGIYAPDTGLSAGQTQWLRDKGIELYSPSPGEGMGAEEIDGRNADPSGRHRGGGVPEL